MTPLLAAALLVVSVDGVDARHLDNAANRRPAEEGGDYYCSVRLLKRPTAAKAGLRTATTTWPLTVDAPVTFNPPEYLKRRRGGSMDTPCICFQGKPATLCQDIAARVPSFRQEWMDDRTCNLATRYLLQDAKADAVFVHLIELDSEANAIVERTEAVSDHGFEKASKSANLKFAAAQDHISGVGREIPAAEIARFAPPLTGKFLFEPSPGVWFGPGNDVLAAKPHETWTHGHWPTRYRPVYAACGRGISPAVLPEMTLAEIAKRFASLLSVKMEGR